MTESQITQEILRYIEDSSYNYAVLIDGEWGCGKTFFVKNKLIASVISHEGQKDVSRKVKYISLYGCKSIQDIQENLVWSVSEEVPKIVEGEQGNKTNSLASKVSSNILLTSKKIANAAIKKFAPNSDPYGLISDWLMVKNYIFIFDDLERCSCPINEVFGLINGLVEHEETKVIIVANEKEICQVNDNSGVALEYMVAADNGIDWPKEEEIFGGNKTVSAGNKASLQELERRKEILFPPTDMSGDYKRIREKLIGVTLHFEPNILEICTMMIGQSTLTMDEKNLLKESLQDMKLRMDLHSHHNLRTFQFFMSKATYLLERIREITIPLEQRNCVQSQVVSECFLATVKYKANIKPRKWEPEMVSFANNRRFNSVEVYVETGEFDLEKYSSDIEKYVEEISHNIAIDDPFSLLKNQFYIHSQKWCETRMEEIIDRLDKNKYHHSLFSQIIINLCKIVNYGFDKSYVERAKKCIIKSITEKPSESERLDETYLHFIEEKELLAEIREIIAEINLAIESSSKEARKNSVNLILQEENWASYLDKYINPNGDMYTSDTAVFCQADSELWFKAISEASIEELDVFRHFLGRLYPRNYKRESGEKDVPIIRQIIDKMNVENEEDVIRKTVLGWLKEQLEEIVECHSR
jgi:KAP family P-loop domain.